MIRINLLPVRQVKKAQAGQRQLAIFALLVMAQLVALFFIYTYQTGEVEAKQRRVNGLQADVARLKDAVGDFDQLKQQRDRLLSQRQIIQDLQKARTGPVWMMRELSNILSTGKGPSYALDAYNALLQQNPLAGFNPNWNPNRLWIESFDEKGGSVAIAGKAKDYDDVAEFVKRLQISKHFTDEFLERNDQIIDPAMKLKVVKFSLKAKLTY